MTSTPLDPSRHRQIRVGALPDYAHARQQQHAILGLSEIAPAIADYPLTLMKHADTGRLNLVALFSFESMRNLYVAGSRWHATYIPRYSLRYPYFANSNGVLGLAIDECSELIGDPRGHRLFDDAGAPTEHANRIAATLRELRRDFEAMQDWVGALTELNLVKPLEVLLRMDDGSETRLDGLYSIDEQALSSLPNDAIVALHRRGYLQNVAIVMASLVQIHRLQQLHNAQSASRIREVQLKLRE